MGILLTLFQASVVLRAVGRVTRCLGLGTHGLYLSHEGPFGSTFISGFSFSPVP